MKVSVQLTHNATGETQVLEVEAASEEAAVGMFDASQFSVTILRPDELDQASRERLERLREKSANLDKAIDNGLVVKLFLLSVVAAAIVGCGLSLVLQSQPSGDRSDSKMSDAENRLWMHQLLDK